MSTQNMAKHGIGISDFQLVYVVLLENNKLSQLFESLPTTEILNH